MADYCPVPTDVIKAVVFQKPGPAGVLKVKDVEKPHLQTTKDVLIEVFASSVNKIDIQARDGNLSLLTGSSPHGCGLDFAGRIALTGSGVDRFYAGDEVYGFLPSITGEIGAYSEFIVVNQDYITPKPKNLSFSEAAGVPLVALTAWQGLVDVCKLKAGERILVHGGAGGVGMWAIQIAKFLKAFVITTCATEHVARCKALGADMVVDYSKQKFEEAIAPNILDLVVDTIGGATRDKSIQILKKEGRILELNPMGDGYQKTFGKGLGLFMEAGKLATEKVLGSTVGPQRLYMVVQPNTTQLAIITKLLDSGAMKTYIDKEFTMPHAKEAHEYLEKGHVQGKVILNVRSKRIVEGSAHA